MHGSLWSCDISTLKPNPADCGIVVSCGQEDYGWDVISGRSEELENSGVVFIISDLFDVYTF